MFFALAANWLTIIAINFYLNIRLNHACVYRSIVTIWSDPQSNQSFFWPKMCTQFIRFLWLNVTHRFLILFSHFHIHSFCLFSLIYYTNCLIEMAILVWKLSSVLICFCAGFCFFFGVFCVHNAYPVYACTHRYGIDERNDWTVRPFYVPHHTMYTHTDTDTSVHNTIFECLRPFSLDIVFSPDARFSWKIWS